MVVSLFAYLFTILTGIVILFQLCLAVGLPWGAASMGGKYPGKYPPKMRIVPVVNMVVLAFIAIIVLSRAGLMLAGMMSFSKVAIWVVAVFFLASTIMNTITPSKIERVWAPVALIQLVAVVIIAFS